MTKRITVLITGTKDGFIDVKASGDTFRLKDGFKSHGFQFDGDAWIREGINPSEFKAASQWVKQQAMIEVFTGDRVAFRSADMAADGTPA